MASYTTGLKLTQPALGDTGWGTTVNSGVTALVDQAVAGVASVAVTAGNTTTLSAIADGASSDARNMSLLITGSLTTGQTATVRVPATSAGVTKLYSIRNEAGQTVAVETPGGDEVSIPHNRALLVRVTSTGVYEAVNYAASLTLDTALAATSGGTGQSSYAVGDLLYAGTTTTLAKLASVATGNVLRAGGVGTAPAWGKVDLTTDVTGILPVANGGTGLSSPGTLGNVLRSDGAGNWTSGTLASATTSAEGLVELATDAEVRTGTDTTRAITPDALRKGALVLGTASSGPFAPGTTAIDYTSIPAWVKRITVMFADLSTSGSNLIDIQLGDSGGIETSGYSGSQGNIISGVGTSSYGGDAFEVRYFSSAVSYSGQFVLTLVDPAVNTWVGTGVYGSTGSTSVSFTGGTKSLSGTLDRLRISANGDSFAAGTINIMYE